MSTTLKPLYIDIGSYKGQEIKWALEHGYDVHAFEPNPNCKQYLDQYADRALIYYVAAWKSDGFENLHLMANPEPGEDGLSMIAEKTNVSKDRVIKVPTINMGMYLKNLDRDVDVLKINAEGSEYIIIKSILDYFDYKRIKKWYVEDHENYISYGKWREFKQKILERCEKLGIKIEPWKGI